MMQIADVHICYGIAKMSKCFLKQLIQMICETHKRKAVMRTRAKFNSTCFRCKSQIAVGQEIEWTPGEWKKAVHAKCSTALNATASKAPAALANINPSHDDILAELGVPYEFTAHELTAIQKAITNNSLASERQKVALLGGIMRVDDIELAREIREEANVTCGVHSTRGAACSLVPGHGGAHFWSAIADHPSLPRPRNQRVNEDIRGAIAVPRKEVPTIEDDSSIRFSLLELDGPPSKNRDDR